MEYYSKLTKTGGYLFLSGFYTEDEADILECTTTNGFEKLKSTERKNWAAILLKKV